MYEKLEKCPSCGHTQFSNHSIVQDYLVSKESFALVQCNKCELVFTNPRPGPEQLGHYYQSDQYISHTNKANNLINLIYTLVRKRTLYNKIKLISSYRQSPGTLLDYGSGTGHFLSKIKSAGWRVTGIEPDDQARTFSQGKISEPIIDNLNNLDKSSSFDIITAWHVLEHVADLQDTFSRLVKLLSKNGYMFIALPNLSAADAKHYKEVWAGYDVPRHLYHFNPKSFEQFISKQRIKLIGQVPMKFDSYYVSLLSEKYLASTNQLFKAFLSGYKSNNQAKKTGNYSSIIYVLQK